MEFFNYAYCSLLHKNNEIDNLNILINNVYKDIENKNTNIKNVLDAQLQNIRLKKYKMLHFKHIIIKLIFEIHYTKQEIKKNTNIKTTININIAQNKLIKRTANVFDLQYKKIQKHYKMYNIFDSIIKNKDSFYIKLLKFVLK